MKEKVGPELLSPLPPLLLQLALHPVLCLLPLLLLSLLFLPLLPLPLHLLPPPLGSLGQTQSCSLALVLTLSGPGELKHTDTNCPTVQICTMTQLLNADTFLCFLNVHGEPEGWHDAMFKLLGKRKEIKHHRGYKCKKYCMLCVCFVPTSGFTGFSISCSSGTMTVEHDDRRPREEARPMVLARTAPSQEEAADLLELLWLNWEAADLSERTDRTPLCSSALVDRRSVSSSECDSVL